MLIKLLQDSDGFDKGDVVEISKPRAEQLIAEGKAELYVAPEPAKSTKKFK